MQFTEKYDAAYDFREVAGSVGCFYFVVVVRISNPDPVCKTESEIDFLPTLEN